MSGSKSRPPAGWRRLLEWSARRLRTPDLAADAAELFADHGATLGERAARSWYRRQTLSALRRALRFRPIVRQRQVRGRPWLAGLPLDVKLGLRMLVKNPGLTAVAVFALALGIPTALWPFHMMHVLQTPLPFDEGERIVRLWHREIMGDDEEGTAHAFSVWRETLANFEEIGASRQADFNLFLEGGSVRPWRGAWLSASTFRPLRVGPLVGRPLLDADEVTGAPDVVVLGYEPWRTLFGGQSAAVGRTIRIGGRPHTVVGVMPEGFTFPSNEHLWLPLRGIASALPGAGPRLRIYGRLADDVSEPEALAELTSVEGALDEAFTEAYGPMRPEIVPVVRGPSRSMMAPFQFLAVLLLGVACGNVGTLVMARNAARSDEVAVRTALGASRARIVSQLFVESLVLALVATGIGLALAHWVTERLAQIPREDLPAWVDMGMNARTTGYALALAVFSAAVAGILPALRATSRSMQGRMQRANTPGGAVRFGGATTALVAAEVTMGVLCIFGAWAGWQLVPRVESARSGIVLEEFLAARLRAPDIEPGSDEESVRERMAEVQVELARRLAAEPGVRGLAFATALPGQSHPTIRLEVEEDELSDPSGHRVMRVNVAPGFFEGLGQSVLAGRDFVPGDLSPRQNETGRSVVVNVALVECIFGGANPIGRRVRYVANDDRDPGPWHEVVGVVGSLGMTHMDPMDPMPDDAGVYHPVAFDKLIPARVTVRVTGDPSAFGQRLREVAADIDPALLIEDARPLTELMPVTRALVRWVLFAVAVVAGVSILLSVASLHALMAVTVTQRTREIGLRSALGADAAGIITVIARRVFFQLTLGIVIAGTAGVVFVRAALPGSDRTMSEWPLALGGAAGIVLVVGILACVAPALRGLRIRPMEALRS